MKYLCLHFISSTVDQNVFIQVFLFLFLQFSWLVFSDMCSDVLPDFPVYGREYYMLFLFVNLDMVVKIRQWWSPLNSEWKTEWLSPLWAADPWFPGFLPVSKQSMWNLLLCYFSAVEVRESHYTHMSFLHEVQISDIRLFLGSTPLFLCLTTGLQRCPTSAFMSP